MAAITVELASPLCNQVGWRKRPFNASQVQDLVETLRQSFPPAIQDVYFDNPPLQPKPFLLFLLNGTDIRRKDASLIEFHDGDLLQVAIALAGG